MVMPYHLHMPSYFLETFTEYPEIDEIKKSGTFVSDFFIFVLLYFNQQCVCLIQYKRLNL